MLPSPLDAVIFDMDGVLLDTETLYRSAIVAACTEQGQQMPDHVHLSLIGTPKDLGDTLLLAHFGAGFDLARYHRSCAAHFADLSRPVIALRPGAEEMLIWLQSTGIPRGVATSTGRATADAQLRAAGIRDRIDVLVTRNDVTNGKPHPESFLRAAAALNAQPARCVAVEDSYNGVRAASAAGMATIMVPDLLPPNAEMAQLCAGILPDLGALYRQMKPALRAGGR